MPLTATRAPWSTRLLLVAFPIVAVGLSIPFYRLTSVFAVARGLWVAVLVAAVLYAVSHSLRAVRLALLAAPSLNMRVRTVLLLHFYTAPVSFIVPFKLGELYRWQQLAWLSANPIGSLVILLLDRALDAVVLLAVIAVILLTGNLLPATTAVLSAVLALATVLGLFAVLVLPACLQTLQAYILQNHSAPRARHALKLIDSTRLMTQGAHDRLRRNVVLLLFISVAVWALESGMLVILAHQVGGNARVFLISLLTMTLSPQTAEWPPTAVISLYAVVSLVSLIAIWPFATALYLHRIRAPRRAVVVRPRMAAFDSTKRLHLGATGRIS